MPGGGGIVQEVSDSDLLLIFFSGMGADSAVFLPQKLAFKNLLVPEWLPPNDDETISRYCERFAEILLHERNSHRCVLGGASFGGIVALEMTKHISCEACFLIGSVRGPAQLPRRIRYLRPFRGLTSFLPLVLAQAAAQQCSRLARRCKARHMAGIMTQFARADRNVLRWSMRQILNWQGAQAAAPVYHIHGSLDPVFPIRHLTPDEVVPGGGHVISMTHGEQVNQFIESRIAENFA